MNKRITFGLILFMLFFIETKGQYPSFFGSYVKKDAFLLDNVIKSYDRGRSVIDKQLAGFDVISVKKTELFKEVGLLMGLNLNDYCKKRGVSSYDNRYIVLQPKVIVATVNEISISETEGNDILWLRSSSYPFRFYPFYNFQPLLNLTDVNYNIENSQYKFIIGKEQMCVETNFFLGFSGYGNFKEHKEKANFLSKRLFLDFNGDPRMYCFNYTYYVERIVLNGDMTKALIQYSESNSNTEALFEKIDEKWVLIKKWKPLQI